MCYSYAIGGRQFQHMVRTGQDVEGLLRNIEPKFRLANAFEHPKMPILTNERLEQFNWGLVPSWVKTTDDASKIRKQTLNAVSETVFEKPSFRGSIKTKRCLIPATGFFEWRHVGKVTFPYYITSGDLSLFWFAGIYNSCEVGDRDYNTFSILTTEANPLMAVIHNEKKRMPVILDEPSMNKWLDVKLPEAEIKAICKPYPADQMKAHTIKHIKISQSIEDAEEVIKPFEYFELEEIPFE